jgi:predicted transcriptional regulator
MNVKSIRRVRNLVGLKQFELAGMAHVGQAKLSCAERGHAVLSDQEMTAIRRVIASVARAKYQQIRRLAAI